MTTLVATARWVPERLVASLFDEVYCAIAVGDGPLRMGAAAAPPGQITPYDCNLVRHILYAAGGMEDRPIGRTEAEGLLAVDTAAATCDCSEWTDLFGKSMCDAVMAAHGWRGPAREVILAPNGAATGELLRSYRAMAPEEQAIAALERQRISIITGDDVRPADANWLADAITRYLPYSMARQTLIETLTEHRAMLLPGETALVDRAPAERAA